MYICVYVNIIMLFDRLYESFVSEQILPGPQMRILWDEVAEPAAEGAHM